MTQSDSDYGMFAQRRAAEREIDPAHESLNSALRGGFVVMLFAMGVLLVLYVLSGLFIVDASAAQRGLVARFGALQPNPKTGKLYLDAGTYLRLPAPFDEKIKVAGEKQSFVIDAFCFSIEPKDRGKPISELKSFSEQLNPGVDGAMLSGDKNLSHGLWTVEYVIDDPGAYVQNVYQADGAGILDAVQPILERLASSCVTREVAHRTVEDILTNKKGEIARRVQSELQRECKALGLGVEIKKVTPDVAVPSSVNEEFTAVTTAEQEADARRNEAEAKAKETLTKAAGANYEQILALINEYGAAQVRGESSAELVRIRDEIDAALEKSGGEVAQMIERAKIDRHAIVEQIKAEQDVFLAYLESWRSQPEATILRLWVEAVSRVLSSEKNEISWVPPHSDIIEVIIHPDLERRREIQETQKRKEIEGRR